ncbi:ABC transporter substrate-binding protein [Nesterenkonia muleiensis]|uniref:ABC transporter substrate-binding protein n=1 Tax=Nesterenkonia muleiensis TaxID=2282648 RepID=UPI000E76CE7A|nr:ABC transporter substrate-binding protein [Nesterenkonia muleiensis]
MTDTIRVTATGRAPGYMPEFVAREFGYFEAENLDVETVVPHDWEAVLPGIESGDWDLALGGIWVPSMFLGKGKDFVVTGQLCHRAGFCVVSREPLSDAWERGLAGRSVLVPGRGGASLTMFLEMYLKEQGAEPGDSRIAHDLTGAMMTELYAGGVGDALMTERIHALRFHAQGHHLAGDLLTDGGDIPWSVYYTTPRTLLAKESAIRRFNHALNQAMTFMNENPASVYVPQIAPWYPAFSAEELTSHTEAMRRAGMWNGTQLTRSSYLRWQLGIVQGGLLERPVQPEKLIASFAWEG